MSLDVYKREMKYNNQENGAENSIKQFETSKGIFRVEKQNALEIRSIQEVEKMRPADVAFKPNHRRYRTIGSLLWDQRSDSNRLLQIWGVLCKIMKKNV